MARVLILFLVALGLELPLFAREAPRAQKGIVDLETWDFASSGPVTLQGEWAFYWQQHLRPTDTPLHPATNFRQIPGFWNRPNAEGEVFPVHGYATYHLRIKVPPRANRWALDIGGFFTSGEVWVNGQLLFQAGKVGPSDETSEHSMLAGLILFENQGETIDIVIPMSNFVHGKAGFGRMRFGPASQLITEHENRLGIYYLILGTIGFMGLYHFVLFFLRRSEPAPLYCGISCLINGTFTFITSGIVFNHFPSIGNEIWWKIFYSCWYLGYPAFAAFAKSLYPQEFSRNFVRISLVMGLGGALWALVMPFRISDKAAVVFQIFGLLHFAYLLYGSIKAHRNQKPQALVFITGATFYFVMIMHDVFASEGVIDAPLRSSYGLFVFFLFQSYILAARFSKAFQDLEVKEAEILTLNLGLERKVEEKTRDIRSILLSIQQGIFMIKKSAGEKLATHMDYSRFLESMFRTSSIVEKDPLSLMFSRAKVNEEQKAITRSIIEASLGEPGFAFEMNQANLIREFEVALPDGPREIWEVDWTPVLHADETVDKILVSLRDVTKVRQLQDEAIEQQKELEYISEIVNVSAAQFDKFIKMSRSFLEENLRLIQSSSKRSTEVIKILFINMHTIKGNARGYQFRKMTGLLHDVEQYYAELLNNDELPWNQDLLLTDLRRVQQMIEKYSRINEEKLGRGSHENQVILERNVVAQQINSLNLVDLSTLSRKDQAIIENTKSTFKNLFYSSSLDVLEDILSESERLARDLKKDKPIIKIEDPGFSLTHDAQELFRQIFTHIVRNSLDHGIEAPQERVRKGKRPSGSIELSLKEKEGFLLIHYRDDGRGLNLAYLQKLGIKRGLFRETDRPSREEIADLIFVAGLSTSAELTEISGRGVGMDAVKRYIRNNGGDIRIILADLRSEKDGFCPFALEIVLPQHLFSRPGEQDIKAS